MGKLKSRTLRAALICGASAAAMALAPLADGQTAASGEKSVYMLRYAQEIADGSEVISQSRDILTARQRIGDRSVLVYDDQNGAMTVERGGKTLVAPLISRTGPERSYAFDYGKQALVSNDLTAASFDVFVRPLLAASPAPGKDARWSVTTSLSALGLAAKNNAPVAVNLSRTYLSNQGKPVVLIEFEIPAFTYASPGGETVTHWARGFAVADPGFGEIHALATQHRASAMSADGSMRPVSVRTSVHGIEADGKWRMSFKDAPQVRAAMDRLMETAGDEGHPVSHKAAAGLPDSLPVLVAGRLDFAAFGMLEGGANPIPTISGAGATPEQLLSALGTSQQQISQEQLRGLLDYLATTNASTPEQIQQRTELITTVTQMLQQQQDAAMQTIQNARGGGADAGGASGGSAAGGSVSPEVARLLDYLSLPLPDPSQPMTAAQIQELQERAQVMDLLTQMLQQQNDMSSDAIKNFDGGGGSQSGGQGGGQGGGGSGWFDYPFTTTLDGQILMSDMTNGPTGPIMLDPRKAEDAKKIADLLTAIEAIKDSVLDEKTREQPKVRTQAEVDADAKKIKDLLDALQDIKQDVLDDANLLAPQLQQGNIGDFVDLPLWIDPNSPDAEQYRQLVAELQTELDKLRALLDGDKDKAKDDDSSGFGDDEDFYENNAFDYTSMVGIIPTDLSRWAEWLATQNVRELERLAKLAGYPNLASALTDAQNIIAHAEDPGYRQWAMQAPSCAGYAGCGPNYLERWWMKQAVVSLGDILADSRGIFSTGGFSDIGISGLQLHYLLRDHAVEDGDIVQVRISQFGKVIYQGQVNLTNLGQLFDLGLQRGVASIEIFAVNEGSLTPNTAQITVDDVVRGQATQTYSLQTGETATLRVEAGAKPGATTSGTSGVGQ